MLKMPGPLSSLLSAVSQKVRAFHRINFAAVVSNEQFSQHQLAVAEAPPAYKVFCTNGAIKIAALNPCDTLHTSATILLYQNLLHAVGDECVTVEKEDDKLFVCVDPLSSNLSAILGEVLLSAPATDKKQFTIEGCGTDVAEAALRKKFTPL